MTELDIVFGIGTRSIDGARLEQRLLRYLHPDRFLIEPIEEKKEYERRGDKDELFQRAILYARQMATTYPDAKLHIGVASGNIPYRFENRVGRFVRHDIATNLEPADAGKIYVWRLNQDDILRQWLDRICAEESCNDSLDTLEKELAKWCAERQIPNISAPR